MAISDIFAPIDEDIFEFRGDARDNVIRNLLTAPDFAELSQRGARISFREAGFRFRDSSFNSIYNDVIGISKLPGNINRLGRNTTPDLGYFNGKSLPGDSKFSYAISYDVTDPRSGATERRFSTVYSDDILSIGNVLDEFDSNSLDDSVSSPPVGASNSKVVRGYIDRSKF